MSFISSVVKMKGILLVITVIASHECAELKDAGTLRVCVKVLSADSVTGLLNKALQTTASHSCLRFSALATRAVPIQIHLSVIYAI